MSGWSPDDDLPATPSDVLAEYIAALTSSDSESRAATGLELEALESIYPAAIRLLAPASPNGSRTASPALIPSQHPSSRATPPALAAATFPPAPGERIRYQVTLPAWEDADPDSVPRVKILVALPAAYPDEAPLLQLLGRYVGNYAIDAGLFGDVTRTFIAAKGVPFTPGEVCIFDGLMHVQALVGAWHAERVAEDAASEALRTADRTHAPEMPDLQQRQQPHQPLPPASTTATDAKALPAVLSKLSFTTAPSALSTPSAPPARPLPAITSSAPIVDRKSAFVGHAARIADASDVAAVVQHLLTDRKIARAAHPTIWAYRLVRDVGGAAGRVVESDYDDDGETQAGSRLKHLLEILELDNVVVVVSRWFGGIHLGPDRFKHINQSARDALEAGGFLDDAPQGGKKKGRR